MNLTNYIDGVNALFRFHSTEESEIENTYKFIKDKLIETKIFSPTKVLTLIQEAAIHNNKNFKSYWILYKKIIDEFHPDQINYNYIIFDYFLYKEYGINFNEMNLKKFKEFDEKGYITDVHKENTIFYAIMKDDISLFGTFEIDPKQILQSEFYPESKKGYSLIELCCYHGSSNCFMMLRSRFNVEITQKCLMLSFMGGNPQILIDCLRFQVPDNDCMKYAIISHNMDFIVHLVNYYQIEIDLLTCGMNYNIEAFMYALNQRNINKCFAISPVFNMKSLCEYFLDYKADINAKDDRGANALYYAVLKDDHEIAEMLILNKINVNASDNNGVTPLHLAFMQNNINLAQYLISHRASKKSRDQSGRTLLHYAVTKNCFEMVQLLILNDFDVNTTDFYGTTALHVASANNCIEIINFLISHHANVNARDCHDLTPLYFATMNNSLEAVKILVSNGAEINVRTWAGFFPFHEASKNNCIEMLGFLLSKGVDINLRDSDNATALHIAAYMNNKDATIFLIDHNADINAKDANGQTPLHYATINNYPEIIEILIIKGANIQVKDNCGAMPLHYAAMKNNEKNCEVFA